MSDHLVQGVHVAVVLAVVLAVAMVGRLAARALRQPEVIGEILAGILAVPAVIAVAGQGALGTVLPRDVLGVLHDIGQFGLVLFLVGVAHELRRGDSGLRTRSVGWVTAGSFVPALATGLLLAGWVLWSGDADLRGTAPTPGLVLMVAVALSVTAVPVLARILEDRGLMSAPVGKLAMTAAVFTDSAAWILLVVAIGFSADRPDGIVVSLVLLAIGVVVIVLGRALLRAKGAYALCARFPRIVAVGVAVAAVVLATQMEHWGLTAVFGAFVVGLAVPSGHGAERWNEVVRPVATVGRRLVPVVFVVAGMGLFTTPSSSLPWLAVVLATGLGILGKVGGGYLGARLAGRPPREALTIGVLMNTRGLTEIVVLQAGYNAGLLSAGLFLALVVMALVTTGLTGPLLSLLGFRARRSELSPVLDPRD